MLEPILPTWAVTTCAVGLAVGTAGLGIWLTAPVLEKLVHALECLVRLIRRTLAARARIQHRQMQSDRLALDYWIRDSFYQKKLAAEAMNAAERANQKAHQERSLREQVAATADALMQYRGGMRT